MGGLQLAKHLAVYGSPTLNVMIDDTKTPIARPGYGWVASTYIAQTARVRVWPGFVAGVRF